MTTTTTPALTAVLTQVQARVARRLDALKAARALLTDPDAWHKGALCAYRPVPGEPALPDAVYIEASNCFCSVGALIRASNEPGWIGLVNLCEAELELTLEGKSWSYEHGIVSFNDEPTTTHADVLAVFDETIARLEASRESR